MPLESEIRSYAYSKLKRSEKKRVATMCCSSLRLILCLDITGTDDERKFALITDTYDVNNVSGAFHPFGILTSQTETLTVNCLCMWFACARTWLVSYIYVILTNCAVAD